MALRSKKRLIMVGVLTTALLAFVVTLGIFATEVAADEAVGIPVERVTESVGQKTAVMTNTITISKTAVGGGTYLPGESVLYRIDFTNGISNVTATNVTIVDSLATEFASSMAATAGVTITQLSGGPNYMWQVADLAPGQVGVITITAVLTSPLATGTLITNNVTLTATTAVTAGYSAQSVIMIGDAAPVAVNDEVTTTEDIAVAVPVLLNDSDSNGEAIAVTSAGTPSAGTAVVSGSSQIVYTPSLNFNGVATFTYEIANADGIVTSLLFDGNDDQLEATGYVGVTGTSARTIEAWIKTTDTSSPGGMIMTWGESANGRRWDLRLDSGRLRVGVNGGNIVGSTNIADGQWHHIAVVLPNDGSPSVNEILFYIDGAVESSSPSSAQAINTGSFVDLHIGASPFFNTGVFNGQMRDVRLWSVARSQGEIQADLNGPLNGNEAGLELYYLMDDGPGSATVADGSVNGRNGSLIDVNTATAWILEAGTTASAVVTVNVTPVNDAPIAVDDTVFMTQTVPITIAVLANDSDPEWDALSVVAVSTPVSGSAGISGTTHVVFTPTFDAAGTITFTYTISDGALTDTAVVAVNIEPCPLFGVLYVDAAATGLNIGNNWNNAYTDLQSALTQDLRCPGPNEIWVAAGVYKPGITATVAFELADGLSLYGGFAGSEIFRTQRDWATNWTILSGDIGDDDNVNPNGIVSDTADISGVNSYHVVAAYGVSQTAVFDGFYITAGEADGFLPDENSGGGMFLGDSNVIISNTTFIGNYAFDYGGGLEVIGDSSVSVSSSVFRNNYAYLGGGIDLFDFAPLFTIENSQFYNNYAEAAGGAIFLSPVTESRINNVLFDGNRAGVDAGAVLLIEAVSYLSDVVFTDNRASNDGAGITVNDGGVMFIDNGRFQGNRASDDGGAIALDPGAIMTMTNGLLSGNVATENGGAIENLGVLNLINTTIAGNNATVNGGGIRHEGFALNMQNVIIWNNEDQTGVGTTESSVFDNGVVPNIDYSLLQGWNPAGTGNLNGNLTANDPDFIAPITPSLAITTGGDYRLQAVSPAIDAGTNSVCPSIDLLGVSRPRDGVCDMGAYETITIVLTPTIVPTDMLALDWNDANSRYNIQRSESAYSGYSTLVADLGVPDYTINNGLGTVNTPYFYQIYETSGGYTSNRVGVFTFLIESSN